MDERDLIEKLKRISALHRGATTQGERAAAHQAYERIWSRLEQERRAAPIEFKFTLSDDFRRRLFVALARKHGLDPYRYKRQRYTTVMLRASPNLVNEVLWPEFEQLSRSLGEYLNDVTTRVIAAAVHEDQSEAAEAKEIGGG